MFQPGPGDFPRGSLADISFHFIIPFLRDQRLPQGPNTSEGLARSCWLLQLEVAPPLGWGGLLHPSETWSMVLGHCWPEPTCQNTRFNQRCMKLSGMRPNPGQKFSSLNKYRTRLPKGIVSPFDKYRLGLFVGCFFQARPG